MANKIGNRKQKLLSRKEELLNQIKYYDTRIEDARATKNITSSFDEDSSDSEIEFCLNAGTSLTELKLHKGRLLTCLHATEELTGVTVLQAELNVVVNAPAFEGEPPITEEGMWREVMAECRVDLVTFSMTFYTHQPSRTFAPLSHRGLHVMPTKLVHERELARSVLRAVAAPSDAVEVLRSYAQAHRARRSALARLAERYADALFMETLPAGGYALRCAGLLRASWTLQNRGSPLAPFHHKLTFDLEYMDEIYIKTIMQAHKQLCDPALDTDGRTLLLAKIIDTCLEVRRLIGPESDAESPNSKKEQKSDVESQNSKRTSDQEIDAPIKPSGIMGPPKSLPKKSRKGKENTEINERKRGNETDDGSVKVAAKKAKITNYKDKSDNNSADPKNCNKKSNVNENLNSKNSFNEDIVENAYFSENEPENKGNKNLPKLDTKPKNTDVFKSTIKSKSTTQTKINTANAKTSETKVSSVDNNQLQTTGKKKVAKRVINTKDNSKKVESKITEKELTNFKVKNTGMKNEDIPLTQNKNPNSKATKNLQTETTVDKDEPKAKKSKMSVVERNKKAPESTDNIAAQNINSLEASEARSKDKTVRDKIVTEKIDKSKNVAKKIKENSENQVIKINKAKNHINNLALSEKRQNFDRNYKQKDKDKKTNTNKKNLPIKESETKSKTNNSKKDVVPKPSKVQTLAERFSSKNKIEVHNTDEKSKNVNILKDNNKNHLINENLLQKNHKSDKEINANLLNADKKSIKNVFKSKSNTNNKDENLRNNHNTDKNEGINKNKIVKEQYSMAKTNLNNNLKLRKSLAHKVVTKTNTQVEKKTNSKIPQKRLSISKQDMKNPPRVSPRKHESKFSSSQDSSKSSTGSVQRLTNIPRLLKKPTAKQN